MLYIVATPIGNLEDITLRALGVLKSTKLIIAENPNHSRKLLQHFGIKDVELVQFAEHNELKVLDRLIERLAKEDACLISDAGTPGISDPGFRLVRAAVATGVTVIPIPGPSAVLGALSASGLPTDRFLFVGFLPKTEPKLKQILALGKTAAATIAAYESPQRIKHTLELVNQIEPQAQVVVARELSKIHEQFLRGTAAKILALLDKRASLKGEITLLISFK